MKEFVSFITRGKGAIAFEKRIPIEATEKMTIPSDCFILVTKVYEGDHLEGTPSTESVLCLEGKRPYPIKEVQTALDELWEITGAKAFLQVKKIGSQVTEVPDRVNWKTVNQQGDVLLQTYYFEDGVFIRGVYGENVGLKSTERHYPNGEYDVIYYSNMAMCLVQGNHDTGKITTSVIHTVSNPQ